MLEVNLNMTYSKSTKGTHVYTSPGSDIPTLYIKKEAFDGEAPESITVTVAAKQFLTILPKLERIYILKLRLQSKKTFEVALSCKNPDVDPTGAVSHGG